MDALFIMLRNVIIFVALAVPGFILAKTGKIKTDESNVLSKMLTFVGVPFLILSNLMDISFDSNLLWEILIIVIIGAAFTFLCLFASAPLTKKEPDAKRRGMLRFTMICSNNGFLGIPLAQAVFGNSPALTFLIVLNILTNIFMFTVGIYLITGDKSTMDLKKAFLSPVLISFLIGIIFNLLNVKAVVPDLSNYSSYFSAIVTPLSMTILGIKMASIKFPEMLKCKEMYIVSAFKLLIFPILGVAFMILLNLLNIVSAPMVLGFFVAFATPTAALASTFSDQYNGDTQTAVYCTLGTTLFCVATVPVLYWILCMLV